MIAYGGYALNRSADRIEQQQTTVVAEQALVEVSDPLAALCESDPTIRARVGPACDTAAQVASAPPESPVDGLDGTDGRDGRDGLDGADGQSPACLLEPTMCRGADGADGRDGMDGRDGVDGVAGRDGVDGAPGRDGSPAAELVVNEADGSQLRCPRTGGDDTAPEYTCTRV
ncbi:hypothetical protein [Pseudonocardia hydrocarbonoxydans]|uniref:hypothetical protein n=1 Tax=Pseudonocardia hydrocarbonoxydans TaxID=76726 RepID=UPI001141B803|nr:hypothetical protein [Pseudonocardia hydrocarbonoxydans]